MPDSPRFSFSTAPETVDVWDFVEVVAATDGTSSADLNPFQEVTLYGIFIDPTGDSTTVMGFCDAADGSTFRVRFMPQHAGAHEFRLTLAVRGEVAATSGGRFDARASSGRSGPVVRDPEHPWHFKHRGSDKHFFYNGTTAYAILGLRGDRMIHALDRLQKHGVNRIRFGLSSARVPSAREWFEPVDPRDDFSFLLNPWVAANPDSVAAPEFDVSRFNVAFWQKAERLLHACRERDIVASVIFYVDGARPGVYPFGEDPAGDDEKRYYAYATARLAAFANVHWDVTNEYRLFRDEAWVRTMAPFLKACDPYKHTMSVHGHGDFRFYGEPWCDYACYQSWDEHGGYDFMVRNRALQAASGVVVPQVNEEYGYEDHYPQGWGESRVAPARSADNRRRLAWEIYMAGGYQTGGETAPPLGGWLNGLGEDDHTEMLDGNHRARRFFESLAWWKCDPVPEVIVTASAKAYCLAEPGKIYVLWLPEGGTVTLNLPDGGHIARWFDPRSDAGFGEPIAVNGGIVPLSPPEESGDWALAITRA
ncbi:MAG: DUF5060 domain-containing protein [Akkermansiaceae bacterium]|nr:DUF5060 domain-containing protein [Armatimonadota bacterium]